MANAWYSRIQVWAWQAISIYWQAWTVFQNHEAENGPICLLGVPDYEGMLPDDKHLRLQCIRNWVKQLEAKVPGAESVFDDLLFVAEYTFEECYREAEVFGDDVRENEFIRALVKARLSHLPGIMPHKHKSWGCTLHNKPHLLLPPFEEFVASWEDNK